MPSVVAFTGHLIDTPDRLVPRFPASLEQAVRDQIRAKLKRWQVRYGFSSAARGGDLLFVEELLETGAQPHVYLPFALERFRETSVGYGWDERFDAVRNDARVKWIVLPEAVEDEAQAYARCNEALFKAAIEKAAPLKERPLLLAIWDGLPGPLGGTGDAVQSWRSAGLAAEVIAPLRCTGLAS